MNLILTGSTGFLGSHLLRRLIKLNHNVVCLKREISNLWRVNNLLDKADWLNLETIDLKEVLINKKIDCILHCATHYGRKEIDPLQTIEANLLLPLKLLHASKNTKVFSFINTDTVLDKRISHYSLSKGQFVDWLKFYSEEYIIVNLALEHFYGPGDDSTKFSSFIINELMDNKEKNIDLTKGQQKRDFIYIDDVISAFEILLSKLKKMENSFHHFEVGTNESVSIKDFVLTVKKFCLNEKTRLKFGSLPYRKDETMETNVDTKALRSLGWTPKFTLKEGLRLTIEKEKKQLLKSP